jgi:nitrogen fixation/metabolism regulation signal transduction histidine kinase
MRTTNTKAVWAVLAALGSLAALGALVYLARRYDELRVIDAVIAVPIAFVLGLAAVILNRRARGEHQRTLGRSGSRLFLGIARLLGTIAFLLAVTAALALAVFAVLVLVFE